MSDADNERTEGDPAETLAERAQRIILYELTGNSLARDIAAGRDIDASTISRSDSIQFSLAYGNALKAALLDLAEQLDTRLRRIES